MFGKPDADVPKSGFLNAAALNETAWPHQPRPGPNPMETCLSNDPPAPQTILVVDDNPGNLGLLDAMLSECGYIVRPAINGALALRSIRTRLPDLILLDIRLPDMDGYEICRRLKSAPATAGVPVVFISALDAPLDKVKAFSAGGIDYITKPFQLEEVAARVRTHLSLRANQLTLTRRNAQLQQEIAQRQAVERQLQKAHEQLEKRVRERTAALAEAIEALELEVEERRQTEAALRESEERYRVAIEQSISGVALVRQGRLLFANQCFLELYGHDSVQAVAGQALEAFIDPADRAMAGRLLDDCHEGGQRPRSAVLRGCRSGGEPLWLEMSAAATTYQGCTVALVYLRDITARRRAEAARERMEQQLRQAQKMEAIGTLAGGIAHDFNNILGAIVGCAEIAMAELPPGSQARPDLERVLKAGQRAGQLVRQILTFSRQSEIESRPLRVQSIIKETVKFLRASLPATIAIGTRLECADAVVLANPAQVQQILLNLCTNAAHAMEGRAGRLEIALASESVAGDGAIQGLQPGGYLRLTVRDNGHGMNAVVVERIFDPFFTTKGVGEGTGLGLSVVHGIVSALGGRITVESAPGRGTAFDVYLPRHEQAAQPPLRLAREPRAAHAERVLVVEDEPYLADAMRRSLKALGYRPRAFQSSRRALEAFRRTPDGFDVLITDLTMPELTGEQLAAGILNIRPQLPIIICTGYSDRITAEAAALMGVRQILYKPVVRHQLAVALDAALRHPGRHGTAGGGASSR